MVRPDPQRKKYVPLLLPLLPVVLLLWHRLPSSQDGTLLRCVAELLLLAAALCFLPWRHRRMGEKEDVKVMLLLALPAGVGAGLFFRGVYGSAGMGALSPVTDAGWLQAAVTLALLPAICEEAFFRGCVTVHLMDAMKPAWACVISTLLFALMHGSGPMLPAHLTISLLCTLLMLGTGRVLPCMLCHLGYDLAGLLSWQAGTEGLLMASGVIPLAVAVHLLLTIRWKGTQRTGRTEWTLLLLTLAGLAALYFI